MSYKMLEHSKIAQQRRHAWIDRKKKPKTEIRPGKCGLTLGKILPSYPATPIHKPSTYRQHEANRLSSDLTSNNFIMKGTSGSSRAYKKNALSQSQFLPPILGISGDSSLSLQPRQSSTMCAEEAVRGSVEQEWWKSEISARETEKENQRFASHENVSPPRSTMGCGISLCRSVQFVPSCWAQKTIILDDFTKATIKKSESPGLYRSCLLVISAMDGREPYVQQTLDAIKTTVIGNRTQRSLAQNKKLPRRDIPNWRSTDESHQKVKSEDKLSSRDSAFGTDTCSETAEVDVELGLEMDHFTHQRIINWIMQVNAILFSPPHTTEPLKYPLIEQDTSIKIVYEGD
ncbi:hypothetical protein FKM82_013642 [Ascaphus truei]